MSYRGRPSKGCEVCRARKVKCDETKPICTRCIRSGSECKYRDPGDLLFKNQTESAAQRAEDNWRKRSKSLSRARSDSIVQSNGEASSRPSMARQRARSAVGRATRHSPLPSSSKGKQVQLAPIDDASDSKAGSLLATPSLGPDLHQIAYDRFIYDFVSPETPNRSPDEPSDAMFTFIPILYHNASPESCLAKIVDAVAYINLANKCNMPQAALLGESSMGEGLKWLSRTIANSEQASSNDALCSTHLLTIYENLTSTNCRETFKAHQSGANALLQLRTVEEYFSSPISAQLYELIFWQQMVGSLNAGRSPPVPIQNILIGRRNLLGPYNESNTSVIEIIWKEADFHARWLELKKSANPPESRRDLQDLLRIGLELDIDFQNWQATMPMNWRHRVSPNTAEQRSAYDEVWQKLMLEGSGAPNEIFSFTNLQRCWVWGFYRTSRMFLLRDILEILNWMLRFPDPSPTSTQFHMSITQDAMNYPRPQMQLQPNLSTASLQQYHTTATRHLVTTIEQTCSAILGSFTVPIPSKSSSSTSVVTMRGYVVLWAMGTMDSILSSGLVPDSSSTMPLSPPSTNCSSPQTYTPMYITHASLAAAHDPSRDPSLDPGLVYHDASTVQENYPSFEHVHDMHAEAHRLSRMPLGSESQTMMRQVPLWDHKARKGHVFDSCPKHPYDYPVDVPAFSSDGVPRGSIDVTARRLWLNRMLYYIGTELGIKKALAVPMLEGYWDVVKAEVADILGR